MTQHTGKRRATKVPPRDDVYRIAHNEAVRLMKFDRARSHLGKMSVMEWSAIQTTAGLRNIEAFCYGDFGNLGNPNDPSDRPHRKAAHAKGEQLRLGKLTDLQHQGLRMIFTIVCVTELYPGRSLGGEYDIVLPGMKNDWYSEMIDDAFDIVEQCNGNLTKSIDVWLNTVRKPAINSEVQAFKSRRAAKARAKADAEACARLDRNPETKEMMIKSEAQVYQNQLAEVIHLFPFTG